jgi:hypothetical protein
MTSLNVLSSGPQKSEHALAFYDSLEPIGVEFMLGNWRGEGFETGHVMDGLLEAYHWHGKRFESVENVHPLVVTTLTGKKTQLNPQYMSPFLGLMMRYKLPKSAIVGKLFQLFLPLLSTSRSKARLRMTEFRGVSTATMSYDQLPINDVFRKVDENTVLGVMDLKGMTLPFFFVLRREQDI